MPAPNTMTSGCLPARLADIDLSLKRLYIIVRPPSTGNSAPVTCPASGDNRKATNAATSTGSAKRASGLALAADCQLCSSNAPNNPASLRVYPGMTTLAVAPELASSIARHLTSASSAALAAADAG